MTVVASSDLKSVANINAFGSYSGTATGSLTIDSDKGVQLPNNQSLYWTNINGRSGITIQKGFHVSFEVEARAITADNAALASSNIYPDSTNSLQTARSDVFSQLLLVQSLDNDDAFYVWYRLGSSGSYIQCQAYSTDGGSTNKFSRFSELQINRKYLSNDGVVYAKVVMSANPTNGIELWINGQRRTLDNTITNYRYSGDSCYKMRLANTTNGIGDGTNNYWLRNLELHDEAYDPVKHDAPSNANISRSFMMGPDSFALGGGDEDGSNDVEFGSMTLMKSILQSDYGITTSIRGGLAVSGQGYVTLTDNEIDTALAKNPTDVILFPTVNDLSESSGTPGWASDYSTWTTAVERVINRIGAYGSVQRIWLLSGWNWLNAAHSSTFTTGSGSGQYNVLAEAHWGDTQYVAAMDNFFNALKTNTNLTVGTRYKCQPLININQFRDADKDGKSYMRYDTRASIPSTLSQWQADLHPAPRGQLAVGRYLGNIIGSALLGGTLVGDVYIDSSLKAASNDTLESTILAANTKADARAAMSAWLTSRGISTTNYKLSSAELRALEKFNTPTY